MKNYYNRFKDFKYVFLEDSFVLDVIEESLTIKFVMELILTKSHPMYSKPKSDEMYCYKNAEIIFSNVKEFSWIEKTMDPSTDATGEIDYGSIDELYFENGFYYIWGNIGELKIKSSEPRIKYGK